ncbi:transcriptional regulator domain-containing protein [Roseibium algicola]|uniref:transcriptional regulator domain-containing protein n=1 Tax=Roseibium algicola TaxID=2857014 RepID=UPI0034DE2A07
MPSSASRPGFPNWYRRETYAPCSFLPRSGWAWEFLRRNPSFQSDFENFIGSIEKSSQHPATYSMPAQSPLTKLGLFFRDFSGSWRRRHLGSGPLRACSSRNSRTRQTGSSTAGYQSSAMQRDNRAIRFRRASCPSSTSRAEPADAR